MENSLEGFKGRVSTEEGIGELEARTVEVIEAEKQTEKTEEK